jgi:hypothetical protein
MGDGGRWITMVFGVIGFVVLAAGLGISAYRVRQVRRRAADQGRSANRAMLRALTREDDEEQ